MIDNHPHKRPADRTSCDDTQSDCAFCRERSETTDSDALSDGLGISLACQGDIAEHRAPAIRTLVITALSLSDDCRALFEMSDSVRILRIMTPFSHDDDTAISICTGHLKEQLRRLQGLESVIAVGAGAHLAVLSACGIPMNRAPYRPGTVTRLPDGLHMGATEADMSATSARRLLSVLATALSAHSLRAA